MTTQLPIPKERLEQILAHCKREAHENMAPISAGSAVEVIGALLAAHEQEPIGAFHISGGTVEATTDYCKDGEWPVQDGIVEVYAHPAPVPAVPDEATPGNITIMASTHAPCGVTYQWDADECNAAADSWNACRAAMLNGGKS